LTREFEKLRKRMVERLLALGAIRTPEIAEALTSVPRHVFLEDVLPPEHAYADQAVMLKFPVSSVSQPQVIANMLEILQIKSGMKVLEIGTASGYNAALLAFLTREPDLVYTIEWEKDLVKRAQEKLEKTGYKDINVCCGDGSLGWPDSESGPFQRMIFTAQTTAFSPNLLAQIDHKGLIVVPLMFGESATLLCTVQKKESFLGRAYPYPVNFVALRGEGASGSMPEWNRQLKKMWKKMQGFCRGYTLDSPELWGVFLFVLKNVLEENSSLSPQDLWGKWITMGRPDVFQWRFLIGQKGNIERVLLQGR